MAEDPALADEVRARAAEAPAETAVRAATSRHASLLAALDDPLLASRAADVRQLGRRAARLLGNQTSLAPPTEPSIVLARELGPADVAELELAGGLVLGIALAEGAATSHVAIMARALALALADPVAFGAQLRAIARAGAESELRVLLPLVESADELKAAEALFLAALDSAGWTGRAPQLGAMIETPAAAGRAGEIAAVADFLSIGTNDLVQYTLGLDRDLPLASTRAAADPEVLGHIAEV